MILDVLQTVFEPELFMLPNQTGCLLRLFCVQFIYTNFM